MLFFMVKFPSPGLRMRRRFMMPLTPTATAAAAAAPPPPAALSSCDSSTSAAATGAASPPLGLPALVLRRRWRFAPFPFGCAAEPVGASSSPILGSAASLVFRRGAGERVPARLLPRRRAAISADAAARTDADGPFFMGPESTEDVGDGGPVPPSASGPGSPPLLSPTRDLRRRPRLMRSSVSLEAASQALTSWSASARVVCAASSHCSAEFMASTAREPPWGSPLSATLRTAMASTTHGSLRLNLRLRLPVEAWLRANPTLGPALAAGRRPASGAKGQAQGY
mmetsp:Transcript_31200/g.99125  ORF Transcript_31200/g.99125 Transcript_31200/m.99125 type:complete len:283 (-) Transcript_31200:144-992(-)